MIVVAQPDDGLQIKDMTYRTGMFSEEEVQCVADIWQQHLQFGPAASGYSFYVDRVDDKINGFVCVGPRGLTDRVYDLYWIVVDPDVHRKGIGRQLLERAEQVVRDLNGRILVIETSGTEKYAGTRAFYIGVGYLHEATLRDLYSDGDDLCIFTKRILPVKDRL